MKTRVRTKVVSTAISQTEYEVLRNLAYQKGKTLSTVIRDILLGDQEVKGGIKSSAPTVTKKMVNMANAKAR